MRKTCVALYVLPLGLLLLSACVSSDATWSKVPPSPEKVVSLMAGRPHNAYQVAAQDHLAAIALLRERSWLAVECAQFHDAIGVPSDRERDRCYLLRGVRASHTGSFKAFEENGAVLVYYSGIGEAYKDPENVAVVTHLSAPPSEVFVIYHTYD